MTERPRDLPFKILFHRVDPTLLSRQMIALRTPTLNSYTVNTIVCPLRFFYIKHFKRSIFYQHYLILANKLIFISLVC